MAEQFSASAAFTNMNNNTDGWGDDWGDWNETSGGSTTSTAVESKGAAMHPAAPNPPTNPYFQPAPPPQQHQHGYTQQQQQQMNSLPAGGPYAVDHQGQQIDQHNHNYLPNYNTAPFSTAAGYVPPPQPVYGQPASFFNVAAAPPQPPAQQRPPSHPPASTTPQLIPTFSQTISDSFDTSASNSWNWAVPDGPKPQDAPPKQPSPQPQQQYDEYRQQPAPANVPLQRLKTETLSPQWSIESQVSSGDRSLESDPSADGSRGPPVVPEVTPRGGVADRLDEVLESLSIKQEPAAEGVFPPPPPSIVGTAAAGVPLVNESLAHQSKASTPPLPPPPVDNPTPVSGPPVSTGPPPSMAPPKAAQIASSNPFKRTGGRAHAATPGLTAGTGLATPAPTFYQQPVALGQPEEQPNVETLTPDNQEILNEPIGASVQREPHPPTVENQEIAPSNDRNQYLQTGHLSEDGYGGVEPSSTPGSGVGSTTTIGYPAGSSTTTVGDANDGRFPPPGLSRYVPGQNEQRPEPVSAAQQPPLPVSATYPEPPPGLDRMVPGGADLQNASDLSRERQADGEVSDATSATTNMPVQHHVQHHHHHHHHNHHGGGGLHHHERVDMSDRNLYLVPGEDDNHTQQQQQQQQQRVVPGGGSLENERPPVVPSVVPSTGNVLVGVGPVATLDIPDEQRELVMDGENPDDRREEPLVGGNAEPVVAVVNSSSGATGPVAVELDITAGNADMSRVVPAPQEPSNTSTADDSDKGGFYGGATGGKGGRREDDTLRRSNKSKSSRDRYDTEDSDYSEHERRRRDRETSIGVGGSGGGGGGGAADQSSSHNRHERTRHSMRSTADRDKEKPGQRKDNGRDRDRDRGDRERDRDLRDRDYDYRDRDRERNRYDRDRERYGGRSSKYDRESRYETDGSKYETERSTRYEKDDKRYTGSTRDDYYRKRDERGPVDDSRGGGAGGRDRDTLERRQRKDKERSDRYRGDERRKDDRYRDGDKRRDRHDRRYDPEDYRTGSRNGTERDRVRDSRDRDDRKEKDRSSKYMGGGAGAATAMGGYGSVAGAYGPSSGYYDPYSYYAQHQQYYEQLRRTNPQAYAEWYRTYYAQMQASQMQRDLLTTDGRESVHSGRSSANDKERIDQIDASSMKPDTATELSMMEPERLTPRKFPEIHPIVNVSAGLLISTKNRLTMNGMADTVKIFSLGFHDTSRKLFQGYPGPLVKGVTHKKSVIEFCEEQLRHGPPYSGALALIKSRGNSINSLHSSSLAAGTNRSSFALLWNYIILLLRQNGTFVGTDISELLMRNKEDYPFESVQPSVTRSANISGRNSSLSQAVGDGSREADAKQHDGADSDGEDTAVALLQEEASKELVVPDASPKTLSELEITDKFRNYLLYGNIGEALEWATEHNLWGHALFLASKVDSRQHANVMMKFANKLTLNDPLQTLYQLLSGRTPASVTSVLDEKWGDWRPHLAMLMSNSSAKPELIKKSITTLGDTLLNRGDLYAAHFCYLLSDVAFGRFADVKQDAVTVNNGTVRLVLLGSAHHNRNFRELSTNESIMMTEIYEYARSLNEDRYSITELQRYKYLLACRMLDQGMQLKCLLYMEQIAEQIQHDPYRFDVEFVRKVYTLGDRLKYYDPVMEKALDESVDNTGRGNIYANVEDPQWLKQLNEILLNGSSTSNYNNASENGQMSYDYSSYGYGADQTQMVPAQEQPSAPEANDINKQFNEINQQLGQLSLQYNDQQQHQQQLQQEQQYQQPLQQNVAAYETNPMQVPPAYDQGYESINQQSLVDGQAHEQAGSIPHPDSYEQQQQQQFSQYNSYDQQQQQHQHDHQQHPGAETNFFTPAPPSNDQVDPSVPSAYDGGYWGAAGNSEAPKPMISMPNSVAKRPGFGDDTDDDRPNGGSMAQSSMAGGGGPGGKPSQPANASQAKKAPAGPGKDGKPSAGGANGGAQGSGWFGGIWNKLSLKPKNQMILPDDKNPKIVWDEVSKRWVNTDENEAETEAYKPPPKMSDLVGQAAPGANAPQMGPPQGATPLVPRMPTNPEPAGPAAHAAFQQAPNQLHAAPVPTPSAAGGLMQSNVPAAPGPATQEPSKVPTLQSNMYKMQRNRTLKRSYVDVFNPSGAAPSKPTEQVLAPAVPTLPNAPGGFFVPGATPNPAAGANQQTSPSSDASEGMPQFYNPNQFGAGAPGSY